MAERARSAQQKKEQLAERRRLKEEKVAEKARFVIRKGNLPHRMTKDSFAPSEVKEVSGSFGADRELQAAKVPIESEELALEKRTRSPTHGLSPAKKMPRSARRTNLTQG